MKIFPHCRVIIFPSNEVISCAVCNDLLDLYLEAELANINVKHAYSKIWQHLQTCESCADYHAWLYRLLKKRTALTSLSALCENQLDVSFLPFCPPQTTQAVTDPGWHTYLRPRLLGEPFLLRFSFAPAYLQTQLALLASDPGHVMVAAEHPRPPHTILQQTIPLPEQEVIVKLFVYPLAGQPSAVRLQANLVATALPYAKLQAKLQWGGIERVVRITERGEANLGPVSLAPGPAFKRTEDIFELTFEGSP